jgi:hypothetical protein
MPELKTVSWLAEMAGAVIHQAQAQQQHEPKKHRDANRFD